MKYKNQNGVLTDIMTAIVFCLDTLSFVWNSRMSPEIRICSCCRQVTKKKLPFVLKLKQYFKTNSPFTFFFFFFVFFFENINILTWKVIIRTLDRLSKLRSRFNVYSTSFWIEVREGRNVTRIWQGTDFLILPRYKKKGLIPNKYAM